VIVGFDLPPKTTTTIPRGNSLLAGRRILAVLIIVTGSEMTGGVAIGPAVVEAGMVVKIVEGSAWSRVLVEVLCD
jgi:hypothetical protein